MRLERFLVFASSFGVGYGLERLRSAGFWSLDVWSDEYADVRPDAERSDEDGYADAWDGDMMPVEDFSARFFCMTLRVRARSLTRHLRRC